MYNVLKRNKRKAARDERRGIVALLSIRNIS
jgi:hypothetical protein